MTQNSSAIEAFWRAYLRAASSDPERPLPAAWGFGSSPEMADALGDLVVRGIKTATCSLFWEYAHTHDPVPKAGDFSIILNGSGEPVCLIETVDVQIRPYNAVEAAFAYEEGEGDRSLAYWREVHWRFFEGTCQEIGLAPTQEMPLVCERFRLVYRAGEEKLWQS
jgi:uncharacterized protein YhfF